MTVSIAKTIKELADSETAKIDIPLITGNTIRLNCIYKVSDAPNFFLVFPPRKLPSNIDLEKHCAVSINAGKTALTLNAKIIEIKGDRTLELLGKNSVKPESLREFFRITTKVPMKASFAPQSAESRTPAWSIEGETLDISGSGILCILPESPPTKHKIDLSMDLYGNQKYIECLTHIIRVKRLRRGRYQVSFHFDSISRKDKDSIISFCLKEQRNNLRKKIQTAD